MKDINELKDCLRKGEVEFEYTKKNGELRKAKGTLNIDIISEHNATPNGNGSDNENVLKYYDLNSNGWRSCLIENIKF